MTLVDSQTDARQQAWTALEVAREAAAKWDHDADPSATDPAWVAWDDAFGHLWSLVAGDPSLVREMLRRLVLAASSR